jgi:hypothetical protein
MKITMNMSSHEIEHNTTDVEYGDDILYSGWNPEVDKLSLQLQLAPVGERRDRPTSSSTKAAELFLKKMYPFPR